MSQNAVSVWVLSEQGNVCNKKDFAPDVHKAISYVDDKALAKMEKAVHKGIKDVNKGMNSIVHLTFNPKLAVPEMYMDHLISIVEEDGFDCSEVPKRFNGKRLMEMYKATGERRVNRLTIKLTGASIFYKPDDSVDSDDDFEDYNGLTQKAAGLSLDDVYVPNKKSTKKGSD